MMMDLQPRDLHQCCIPQINSLPQTLPQKSSPRRGQPNARPLNKASRNSTDHRMILSRRMLEKQVGGAW